MFKQLWLCVVINDAVISTFLQEQYILIHEVVLESIRWGNTEIPVSELPPSLADCEGEEGEEGGQTTGIIEKMFNVRQSCVVATDTLYCASGYTTEMWFQIALSVRDLRLKGMSSTGCGSCEVCSSGVDERR